MERLKEETEGDKGSSICCCEDGLKTVDLEEAIVGDPRKSRPCLAEG